LGRQGPAGGWVLGRQHAYADADGGANEDANASENVYVGDAGGRAGENAYEREHVAVAGLAAEAAVGTEEEQRSRDSSPSSAPYLCPSLFPSPAPAPSRVHAHARVRAAVAVVASRAQHYSA
jgi:hypothetical protein